jgi:hypothetical protein
MPAPASRPAACIVATGAALPLPDADDDDDDAAVDAAVASGVVGEVVRTSPERVAVTTTVAATELALS